MDSRTSSLFGLFLRSQCEYDSQKSLMKDSENSKFLNKERKEASGHRETHEDDKSASDLVAGLKARDDDREKITS